MSFFLHHDRRRLVWLCIVAALLAGLGAQRHSLAHALQAMQASQPHEPWSTHSLACEQCLQFAATDGQVPIHTGVLRVALAGAPGARRALAAPLRSVEFNAYVARAPPRIG